MFRRTKQRDRQRPSVVNRESKRPFSYYKSSEPRTPIASEQVQTRQAQKKQAPLKLSRQQLWFRLVVFIFFLITVMYTLYIDIGSVRIVYESDNSMLQSTETYETSIQHILSASISSRSKVTINTDTVLTTFKEKHPEVLAADLSFTITGHRPILRITGDAARVVLDDGSQEYRLLNANGKVIRVVDKSQFDANSLPVVLDRSNISSEVGEAYLASEEVRFIERLIAQSAATSTSVISITLPALSRELHVRFVDSSGLYVKFYTGGDADVQFGTYRAALNELAGQGKLPTEYFDVRVEGRAFVK